MNFQDPDIIYLGKIEETPDLVGKGLFTFRPNFENPYKYCSVQTLNYLKTTLKLEKSDNIIQDLVTLNPNTNPLKATTLHNLLHCGLIYGLDLIDLIFKITTEEHFTNLRLMIYIVTLMPEFGSPTSSVLSIIKKIKADYLRYLLSKYHIYGLDPIILTEAEIYQIFETFKIPPKWDIYNQRYERLKALSNLRPDIIQILCTRLYKTTDLSSVVTKTTQSNLERILLTAFDYEDLVYKLGMSPLNAQDPNFDVDQYILENFMEYIHYTDPAKTEISDLYTAIDNKSLVPFLSRHSDSQILELTSIFVAYKSRVDLIKKIEYICGNIPRMFIKLEIKPIICYGNFSEYRQYTSAELIKAFEQTPIGFWNLDRSVQFSIYDINELCETGIYFKEFEKLIKICKDKIKNLKNKNN
jgi:hypothetical protein